MANVPHSGLTGSDLHESKGVATAAANRVYITNGSGSGSWTTVPMAAMSDAASPFEKQLLHVREEQTSANSSTGSSSSTNNIRILNQTKTNEITGASLASNQVTLPAGTYWLEAFAPFIGQVSSTNNADWGSQLRWYNVTDSSYTLNGISQWDATFNSGLGTNSLTVYQTRLDSVRGRFTIAGSKVFELRHWMRMSGAGAMYSGFSSGIGGTEVFADVYVWKVA